MAGHKARRARNQSYRSMRRRWNAGHRPIIGFENVSSAGLYASVEGMTMTVDGHITITGVNEKGERVQESWGIKHILATTFDEWLRYRNMKKTNVRYFMRISHISTGTITQLGPKPAEEPQHERIEAPNGELYCVPWCYACELAGKPEDGPRRLTIELGKHGDWDG